MAFSPLQTCEYPDLSMLPKEMQPTTKYKISIRDSQGGVPVGKGCGVLALGPIAAGENILTEAARVGELGPFAGTRSEADDAEYYHDLTQRYAALPLAVAQYIETCLVPTDNYMFDEISRVTCMETRRRRSCCRLCPAEVERLARAVFVLMVHDFLTMPYMDSVYTPHMWPSFRIVPTGKFNQSLLCSQHGLLNRLDGWEIANDQVLGLSRHRQWLRAHHLVPRIRCGQQDAEQRREKLIRMWGFECDYSLCMGTDNVRELKWSKEYEVGLWEAQERFAEDEVVEFKRQMAQKSGSKAPHGDVENGVDSVQPGSSPKSTLWFLVPVWGGTSSPASGGER